MTRSCSRRRRSAAGFTLLEVLIALALLALVLIALSGSVRFGTRAWESQERRETGSAELEALYGVLRQIAAEAQPLPLIALGENGAALYILGRPHGMSLVSSLPEALGEGGAYDVVLEVADDGRLMLRWRPHVRTAAGISPAPFTKTELARGVASLDIEYFLPRTVDHPGGWLTEWQQPAALPALIRIRLRFRRGDPRGSMEMMVAPLIGASLG